MDDAARTSLAAHSERAARSRTALLLIDLINSFEFPAGTHLFRRALPAARAAGVLLGRARLAGVPAIYVNDVFDTGATSLGALVEHHRGLGGPAAAIVESLPADPAKDHFVAKPRYSGFYCTGLEALLRRLDVQHLILTGVAADICVLATAFDAHMRGFGLSVPRDCVAAETGEAEQWALRHMERVLGADLKSSLSLSLPRSGAVA